MRKILAIVFLALAVISLVVWAISQFLIPILPAQIGNGVILFFVALNSTVAVIAGSKDVIELLQVVFPNANKRAEITKNASTPFPKNGCWVGNWTSPKGFLFECEINLTFGQENIAQGSIVWTLRRAPQQEFKSKINARAIEHVIGSYSIEDRKIEIRGLDKEDPNQIIAQDLYRLTLSNDSKTLRGETQYFGDWQGAIIAKAKT
jgi:hypothetical protein